MQSDEYRYLNERYMHLEQQIEKIEKLLDGLTPPRNLGLLFVRVQEIERYLHVCVGVDGFNDGQFDDQPFGIDRRIKEIKNRGIW